MNTSAENFNALMGQLPAFIEEVQAKTKEWAGREFTGTADEERISATVDFAGMIKSIEISLVSKRTLDSVTMGELIVRAVHEAEAAAVASKAELLGGLQFGPANMGDVMSRAEADGGAWMA